jgi:hypothetical protein
MEGSGHYLVPGHEGMNEQPGVADRNQHRQEDEAEHQPPRRTGMRRPGCLRIGIFFGVGHCLVYGEWLPPRKS